METCELAFCMFTVVCSWERDNNGHNSISYLVELLLTTAIKTSVISRLVFIGQFGCIKLRILLSLRTSAIMSRAWKPDLSSVVTAVARIE